MWFKNCTFYRFSTKFDMSVDMLNLHLEKMKFVPCGTLDSSKSGWDIALPGGTMSTHFVDNRILLRMKTQEKILPSAVVKELLDEKIEAIESAESRKLKKKEKDQLKEDLIHSLLPQAFTKSSFLAGYIDLDLQLLIINTGTKSKADDFMAMLRKSLGSLPVEPIREDGSIELLLTHWLKDSALPQQFSFEEEAELLAPEEDGALIKVKRQDLNSDEITKHLDGGKQVQRLSISYEERMTFVLCADLALKSVKFTDVIKDQNDDIPAEDKLAKLDADFALMSAELSNLLSILIPLFKD